MSVGIERRSIEAIFDQTADVAVAASTTQVDVPGLSFEMEAGVQYAVEVIIAATAAAAGQDVDAGVSGVTDLTGTWLWETQDATNVRTPAPSILSAGAIASSAVTDIADANDVGFIWGRGVISSAAGGTFQVQAAQGTASGTTTIQDSELRARIVNQ